MRKIISDNINQKIQRANLDLRLFTVASSVLTPNDKTEYPLFCKYIVVYSGLWQNLF